MQQNVLINSHQNSKSYQKYLNLFSLQKLSWIIIFFGIAIRLVQAVIKKYGYFSLMLMLVAKII